MNDRMYSAVLRAVTSHSKKNKKLVLIVITFGGTANPAYRVGRFLQSTYDEIHALVPSFCKSAGTLLITAAHTLIMSPFGEIGPLDVQLLQRDEIYARRSGLTTRSALLDLKDHAFELFEHFMYEIVNNSGGSVSFRLASDISVNATATLISKIYEQINPNVLGQDFRDLHIAQNYAERLNKRYHNLSDDGLKKLVYDYPSHDFVIDLEEAKEVYERAILPTTSLFKLMAKRSADMMLPKAGQRPLVEMLTIDGQPIAGDKTHAATGTQNAAKSSASQAAQGGDTGGTNGSTRGSSAIQRDIRRRDRGTPRISEKPQ